ncbi:MAG: hypothetical protein R2827_12175 [Bdellovibrionales bacterium]
MKYLGILFTLMFGLLATAEDYKFQNFDVDEKAIENYLYKKIVNAPGIQNQKKLSSFNSSQQLQKSIIGSQQLNGLESPLMQEIRQLLEKDFTIIRNEQRQILYQRGQNFNLGVENYSGLTWQKPMGQYTLYADREVTPAPNSDLWTVSDQLVIAINAQTFLREMGEAGLIDISEAQLGAFAGLQFHRVYEYKYFVQDYNSGIQQNFDKLLLGFLNFIQPRADLMGPNEVISKKDFMGFYAGALADIPLKYGLSLAAGALVKSEKMSEIELKSLSEQDILRTGDFLKVRVEKSQLNSFGAEAGLKFDFFNLLKLTLLSFEYHLIQAKSQQTHLSFSTSDLHHFTSDTKITKSLADLMHLKKMDPVLFPFLDVKQFNATTEEIKNFKFFNSGTAKSQTSTQSQIYFPGEPEKYVINHKSSHLKYKKGWKGALWDMALQSSIGFDIFANYKYSHRKSASLEYERMSQSKNFSVEMIQEFFVYNTHEKTKYKNKAMEFLEDFTYFPETIKNLIDSENLRGPLKIKVVMKIYPDMLFYVDTLQKSEVLDLILEVCGDHGRRNQAQARQCIKKLEKSYRNYSFAKDVDQKLWQMKDFVTHANLYAPSITSIEKLFGASGIYISGSLKAKTNNNVDYKTYFERGTWSHPTPISSILYPNSILSPTAPLLN